MSSERQTSWLWLEAFELADQAERMQRRFLRYLGPGTEAVNWEPPVDIFETPDGLLLQFALPGVAAEDIELRLEQTTLTVSAVRRLSACQPDSRIRCLEIPHGRFVRRLTLGTAPLAIDASRYLNGCLEVCLVRTPPR